MPRNPRPEYMKEWRLTHKTHLKIYNSNYHNTHREKRRTQMQAWKRNNRRRVQILNRRWNAAHPKERREHVRKYLVRHPEYKPDYQLRYNYGITLAEYNRLLKKQKGRCAICKMPPPKHWRFKRLSVDHCHTTNRNRGLLCHVCNLVVGQFKDNAKRFRAAAKYLEHHAP
jgi:hypothetical protein